MIATRIGKAIAFRAAALSDADACVRVVAGASDDLPGLVIDRYGRFVVASDYDPAGPGAALAPIIEAALPECAVVVRTRTGKDGLQFHFGQRPVPESLMATEDGLKFEIRTDPRHDFGLFLDGRAARQRVFAIADGALVLNLFAYTCGFAVAARAGGARDVINVDPEKDYLTWGRRNAALNQTDFRVFPDKAQDFLRRWRRRHDRGAADHFDVIVVDPPAFGVGRGDDRILRKFWPELLASIAIAAPQHAILMCNDKAYSGYETFHHTVADALGPGYEVMTLEHGPEIRGRDPSRTDPWYRPPRVLHARRQ